MLDMTILELPGFPNIEQQWRLSHCLQMLFEIEWAEVAHRRDIGPPRRDLKFEAIRLDGVFQRGQIRLKQAFLGPFKFTPAGDQRRLQGR